MTSNKLCYVLIKLLFEHTQKADYRSKANHATVISSQTELVQHELSGENLEKMMKFGQNKMKRHKK